MYRSIKSLSTLIILISFLGVRAQENSEIKVFEEINGVLTAEAEDFVFQTHDSIRKWYSTTPDSERGEMIDVDENNAENASGKSYLELLPDTRTTHDDILTVGENFSNEPGKMAILYYYTYFNSPGKYYVWVRTNTSGTEDNGIHVGVDGTWPASGQRMQFDGNKKKWSWESRQRTEEVHTGVEKLIYIEIKTPGFHIINFSMREDGFEFDKWIMTKVYERPLDLGSSETVLDRL